MGLPSSRATIADAALLTDQKIQCFRPSALFDGVGGIEGSNIGARPPPSGRNDSAALSLG
jgi:hypothetical protein